MGMLTVPFAGAPTGAKHPVAQPGTKPEREGGRQDVKEAARLWGAHRAHAVSRWGKEEQMMDVWGTFTV